jgi:hypothetical protein
LQTISLQSTPPAENATSKTRWARPRIDYRFPGTVLNWLELRPSLIQGCDAENLQPINVNGWFWADGNKRIPPTNIPSRLTFWSRTGQVFMRLGYEPCKAMDNQTHHTIKLIKVKDFSIQILNSRHLN